MATNKMRQIVKVHNNKEYNSLGLKQAQISNVHLLNYSILLVSLC